MTKSARAIDHHTRDIVRGGGVAFLTRGTGTAVALVFNLVLARMLGAAGTGIYFLAVSVVMVAAIGGRLGLDNTLLRHVAAGGAASDWAGVRGAYRRANVLAISMSVAIAALLMLAAPWIAENVFHKAELTAPLRWMALATPALVAVTMGGVALQGLHRIFEAKLVDGILTPTGALILVVPLAGALGVRGAILSQVVGASVAAIVGFALWRRATGWHSEAPSEPRTADLLRTSIPLFWYAALAWVMNWIGTWFLGIWGTSAEVGAFALAARTTQVIAMLLAAVNTVVAPQFAAFYKRRDFVAMGRSARQATLVVTLLGAPVIALFLIAPSWIMSLYGKDFVAGGSMLAVLALGQLVNIVTGPVVYLLMMTELEHSARNASIVGAACSLLGGVLLVPRYGGVGAAVATALGLTGANVSAAVSVYRKFGLVTLPWLGSFPRSRWTA